MIGEIERLKSLSKKERQRLEKELWTIHDGRDIPKWGYDQRMIRDGINFLATLPRSPPQ